VVSCRFHIRSIPEVNLSRSQLYPSSVSVAVPGLRLSEGEQVLLGYLCSNRLYLGGWTKQH